MNNGYQRFNNHIKTILVMEIDKIYNEDCLVGMKGIPDQSVDLIVTDPPYKLTPRGSSGTMSGYWTNDITKKGKVFENNDVEIEDYLGEFYRILKDTSHCYIMCNNLNLPHFFEVISKSKFNFVKLLVWDKCTKICGKYYMGQVEHIFLLRKGGDKPINDCGTSDILAFPNKKDKAYNGENIHDSQKPIGLFQTMIENSSKEGEIILDPFMGSGSTVVAAKQKNRKGIGIDKEFDYCKLAMHRVLKETK